MRLLLLLCALLSSPALATDFTITYWVGPPPAHATIETYRLIADAGFTHCPITLGPEKETNLKLLDLVQAAGLKAIATHASISAADVTAQPNWQAKVEQVVNDYAQHPALAMWQSQDEPMASQFPALAQIKSEIAKHDPAHPVFINLFPTYANGAQLGVPTYQAYLDAYASTVHPAFVSYDHYALMSDGSHRGDYFQNLDLVRKSALGQRVPAWNGILSFPHYGYADPTEAQMRWQVFTTLAAGMKGYYWFTLFPPGGELGPAKAVFDEKGNPARLYPIVRQLNHEASTLARTLAACTSTSLYFTGPTPAGCAALPADAPLQPTDRDLPLMFGSFAGPADARYVLIVNTDYAKPVTVRLAGTPRLTLIRADDGVERPFARTDGEYRFALPAGDGRLFKLDR